MPARALALQRSAVIVITIQPLYCLGRSNEYHLVQEDLHALLLIDFFKAALAHYTIEQIEILTGLNNTFGPGDVCWYACCHLLKRIKVFD